MPGTTADRLCSCCRAAAETIRPGGRQGWVLSRPYHSATTPPEAGAQVYPIDPPVRGPHVTVTSLLLPGTQGHSRLSHGEDVLLREVIHGLLLSCSASAETPPPGNGPGPWRPGRDWCVRKSIYLRKDSPTPVFQNLRSVQIITTFRSPNCSLHSLLPSLPITGHPRRPRVGPTLGRWCCAAAALPLRALRAPLLSRLRRAPPPRPRSPSETEMKTEKMD
ncbi:hypothetical protein PVAP13_3KG196654 [Panicum virgatum]|uniref:Uncharacterized protein n=1 Tax=Panicum virgatum TaxID=38727 RepID=A0A8T0UKW0_PANVG|nr:hypothetical protein PVAP13_3KG196654 [Panicum virgatum]